MSRGSFTFILLWLFLLPVCSYAASGDDAPDPPLTLLQEPQKSGRTIQNPALTNPALTGRNEELRDIYGPVPITEPPPYLLITGAVCLLVRSAALLYWFLRKKGTKTKTPPPIPPWEKALLDLADAKSLLSPKRGLLYMDRVSQILRSYIESRFAIQSTRQTTREFLQGLTGVGDSSPLQTYKPELKDCLEQADMAKFAHHLPQLSNLERMEVAVTTFIQTTEPVEPQESAKPAKLSRRSGSERFQRGRS
jgi:hypothetical protein